MNLAKTTRTSLKWVGFKYAPRPRAHDAQESPIFQLQVTFAAMQNSKQSVFNPVKLVESLRLRTTEQQDAQEYVFVYHDSFPD